MAWMDVVFRMLDKAGATFIEPRVEDGHGSDASTPSLLIVTGKRAKLIAV